jgi:hypothetical protein
LISGQWQGWWIYWIGPLLGTHPALLAFSFLTKRIEVAKLYYFDSDQDRLFRRRHSVCAPAGIVRNQYFDDPAKNLKGGDIRGSSNNGARIT